MASALGNAGAEPSGEIERLGILRPLGPSLLARMGRRLRNGLRQWVYTTPLHELRLKGRHPLRLLGSPDDPWPGDREAGEELMNGSLSHGGVTLSLDGAGFWSDCLNEPRLCDHVLGFVWLRDLACVADQRRARMTAESLMRGFLAHHARYHPLVWRADLLARRLMLSLLHAPLILSNQDLVYRSAVLNALARQARHLMRAAGDVETGTASVEAASGLILAGLLLPHGAAARERGEALLRRSLDRMLLPDGGVLSRSVGDMVHIMQQLITVRDAMTERGEEPPEMLQHRLDRMAPTLRMLLHHDGRMAHIAGGERVPHELIERVLAASDARGKAPDLARATGLARLSARRSLLILDAMPPPPDGLDRGAHAGCLAFEFSDRDRRLVVNIGHGSGELASLCRTTAAHSTLVLDDRNQTEIMGEGLGEGVNEIRIERRLAEAGRRISASHDGYRRRFSLLHRRTLALSPEGDLLEGEDRLEPAGRPARTVPEAVLRFHLHPDVTVSMTEGGHAILLRLDNRHGWLFRAGDFRPEIEESLYVEDGTPRRSSLILVRAGVGPTGLAIPWRFERL